MKPKTRALRRFINWRWHNKAKKAGRLFYGHMTPTYLEELAIGLWPKDEGIFPIEQRLYHG